MLTAQTTPAYNTEPNQDPHQVQYRACSPIATQVLEAQTIGLEPRSAQSHSRPNQTAEVHNPRLDSKSPAHASTLIVPYGTLAA